MNPGLREALAHLERDFALLPVRADKTPATDLIRRTRGRGGWRQLVKKPATATEVCDWFELDPETGVGVLTGAVSNVAVVDVDYPAVAPATPTTATVATRRAFHAYLRTDLPIRTREYAWGSVRGERSYVVAPCSRRTDGGAYAWQSRPEEIGLADFAEFENRATATYIRSSSNKRSSSSAVSLAGLRTFADLESDEGVALRLGHALGVPEGVELGESFPCLIHADERPSAALWRYQPDASVLYKDWHAGKHGGSPWMPLARVRAILAGRTQPLNPPEFVVWRLRLAWEAGLLEPVEFERPPAPSWRVDDVWQGFLDLVGLRWTVERGNPTAFSVNFASAWCGVPRRRAHEAISELARAGSLRLVGRDPRGITRLWLPEGVRPLD